jgi:hypothetical protein
MRRISAILAVVVVGLLAACRAQDESNLELPCAQPDSLRSASLLFSDAIYGIRGTSGGTLIELSQDSTGWSAVLEPVWSDFPSESDMWPEEPETLSVRWVDFVKAQGRLLPRSDTFLSANQSAIGDSLGLLVNCTVVGLVRWYGSRPDTVELERRSGRGLPY